MKIVTKEIHAKSVLSKSGISSIGHTVNPYVGCAHACSYCYASFMKRFSGHREPWGEFVDVKVNAPRLLAEQIVRFRGNHVFFSSVTDPYQPAEEAYAITRHCLEALVGSSVSVSILTKSPLVFRDLQLLKKLDCVEVGITLTTDDDRVRRIFEPHAPSIEQRLKVLRQLFESGISTYTFVGPVLPMNPERLSSLAAPFVRHVLFDRMNYAPKTVGVYRRNGLTEWLNAGYVDDVIRRLQEGFSDKGVSC